MGLLIRADGGGAIGAGHLMRCLALAQAERDRRGDRAVTFAIPRQAEALTSRLAADADRIVLFHEPTGSDADADHLAALAREIGADRIVLDGYSFGSAYRRRLRAAGCAGRLIVIDDEGGQAFSDVDAVVNPNLGAEESLYRDRSERTRLLLGSRFALFRREFRKARPSSAIRANSTSIPISEVRRIIVTLGASDPNNATLRVVEALRMAKLSDDIDVDIVIGAWHPDPSSVVDAASVAGHRFTARRDVADMASLLNDADLAIIGGGSTLWECARLGVPPLVLILADNQRPGATRASTSGIAALAGDMSTLSVEALADRIRDLIADAALRDELARNGRKRFDGQGASRILETLDAPLRPALLTDRELVFGWVNDPATRAAAFAPDPVPWATHVAWFGARLNDPHCWFFLGLDDDQPAACVRFDDDLDPARAGETTISVMVAPDRRGRGLGQRLIRAGADHMIRVNGAEYVNAYIRPDNPASIRGFEQAGFVRANPEPISYRGCPAWHYRYC